jgi:hypothetical protein
VFLVFWGSWWVTDTSGKAKAAQKALAAYFSGLGGATDHWSAILNQYYLVDPGTRQKIYIDGTPSPPPLLGGSLKTGTIVDMHNPPSKPSQAALAKEAALPDAVSKLAEDAGSILMPLIILPPGSVSSLDITKDYCGHHGWGFYNVDALYGNTLWQPLVWAETSYDQASNTTDGQNWSCNYNHGTRAGLTITMGHEYAEGLTDSFGPPNGKAGTLSTGNGYHYGYKATDPAGTVWIMAPGWTQEIADLCAHASTPPFQLTLPTGTFWAPQLWNLATGKCAQGA